MPESLASCLPAQVQLGAQRLPPECHLGAETGVLQAGGLGKCYLPTGSAAHSSLTLSGPHCGARTMIMLDSWTSGRSGGTRAMVTLAVTETVVPEGLMVQRGGARTRSSSFSGESITAGLWGQRREGGGSPRSVPR